MFISEFNRLLNVKSYIKTLKNGNVINVKGYRKTLKSLNSALNDLKLRGLNNESENLYFFNPISGKVSKVAKGNSNSVSPELILKKIKSEESYNKVLNKRWVLHNHPNSKSLSLQDFYAVPERTNIFSISSTGSIFRGYPTSKFKTLTFEQLRESQIDMNFLTEVLKKKMPELKIEENEFLVSHFHNLNLKDNGYIHYRTKLSKKDKELVDNYGFTIKNNLNFLDYLIDNDPKLYNKVRENYFKNF